MTEKFKAEDWLSINGLHLDLSQMMPPGVNVPQRSTLESWAESGKIPAWRRPGGWLVHRRDLPAIAEIITAISRRSPRNV